VAKKSNLDAWKCISHLQRLEDVYQKDFAKANKDVSDKLRLIKLKVSKKKKSTIDLVELESFCIDQWKKAIRLAIKKLLDSIQNRKTKGSEFSQIMLQLNKIKEDIDIEDFDLDQYENIYDTDLKGFKEQVKEKIDIEKYTNKRFWIGLLIGFVLGLVGNYLLGLLW
jgi:hypothetical protein